ncbi:MAG: sigma-70 family RNA polymerase sigma factor [Bacteroidia bacterium]|nr:sigma-70 family RNA polymerase sigma factor [Bacteroidia bacterium]
MNDPHLLLVERCKTGDSMAQFELHRKYRSAMLRVAWRFTKNQFEAEDIVQEAFLKAFRSLNLFEGESTFGAWLKRITINTSINHIKKRRLDLVPLDTSESLESDTATASVFSQTDESIPMPEISVAINQLPAGYRQVLKLYLFEGFDHQEIGDILSISEATSKSQYCRAKRKLRSILQHQFPHYEAA